MGDTVAVIGAGLMGSGIAQVAAVGGFDVRLQDVSEQAAARGLAGIEKSLGKLVDKAVLDGDAANAALQRIDVMTTLPDAVAEAEVVVEAVIEDVSLKQEIFAAVEAAAPATSILATNTSAIPITRIAAATKQPERVVGTHFFSPVPLMPLVELVRGQHTSAAAPRPATEMAKQLKGARYQLWKNPDNLTAHLGLLDIVGMRYLDDRGSAESRRAAREERIAAEESTRRNLARRELAWLRRGAPARTKKSKFRVAEATAPTTIS